MRANLARKILLAAYHILATGSDYHELGSSYLDQINQRRTANQLTCRLRDMGYHVDIRPNAA
jgi:transposase